MSTRCPQGAGSQQGALIRASAESLPIPGADGSVQRAYPGGRGPDAGISGTLIAAIDPGRSTGWAISDGRSGLYHATRGDDGEALARWWRWLRDLLIAEKPRRLVIERAFFGRVADADFTGALVRVAHGIAWSCGVPRSEYAANTVRKSMLGKGAGSTDFERVAAARALGWNLGSDHCADAVLLLEHHMRAAAAVGREAA